MEDDDDLERQERWWPTRRERTYPSGYAGKLIAEILGPVLAHELPSVIEDAERLGLEISDELKRLVRDFQEADGRRLTMLPLLAGAVALSYDFCFSSAELSDNAPGYTRAAYRQWPEILKQLGDVAYVAAQMHGFDEGTWSVYVGATDFDDPASDHARQWPPHGIDYQPYF